MERDDVGMISKKRRIDYLVTGDIPNLEGEGSSKVVETQSSKATFVDDDVVYRLYFKGMVSNEIVATQGGKMTVMAGFGVAICDQTDKLLFELKEPSACSVSRNAFTVIEVKLLSGYVPTCLDYGCNIELTLESCSKVLTRKLIELWKHKVKEDSIPATERIYCPYPNCSTLMSKADLPVAAEADQANVRACVKCSGLFCIDCKVPSHRDLSGAEYKKLRPEPLVDDSKLKFLAKDKNWRQCVKCRHMIELSQGCNQMTCRCGYEFCYKCGVEWRKGRNTCPSCSRTDHGDVFDGGDDDENDNPWAYGCGCDYCCIPDSPLHARVLGSDLTPDTAPRDLEEGEIQAEGGTNEDQAARDDPPPAGTTCADLPGEKSKETPRASSLLPELLQKMSATLDALLESAERQNRANGTITDELRSIGADVRARPLEPSLFRKPAAQIDPVALNFTTPIGSSSRPRQQNPSTAANDERSALLA
ncbi:hypothetical protein AALP_AAs64569U000200 [Arabis alpina]|uniref:RBR-type E3 ubiquitin transferase n=1 Tax=Arabis alpina TaxID=50452 RepID=A0A087FZ28_ARAAL|nr:hypothetical protein AALP_AAs64569U000200 [Arabis alpina]